MDQGSVSLEVSISLARGTHASPDPPDPPDPPGASLASGPTTSLPQRRAPDDVVATTTSLPSHRRLSFGQALSTNRQVPFAGLRYARPANARLDLVDRS